MIKNFDTIQHDPWNTGNIPIDDFDFWGFEAICTFIWWRIVFLLPDDRKKQNKNKQTKKPSKQTNKQTKTTHPPKCSEMLSTSQLHKCTLHLCHIATATVTPSV
jgi:hypothetical protein